MTHPTSLAPEIWYAVVNADGKIMEFLLTNAQADAVSEHLHPGSHVVAKVVADLADVKRLVEAADRLAVFRDFVENRIKQMGCNRVANCGLQEMWNKCLGAKPAPDAARPFLKVLETQDGQTTANER